MNRELLIVIEQIGREKGIDKETLFEALESALLSASRKSLGPGGWFASSSFVNSMTAISNGISKG